MDEDFIPYSMIEPLLVEGMTGRELARLLRDKTGIPTTHRFRIKGGYPLPLAEAIKRGVHIVKADDRVSPVNPRWLNEPVR